MLSKVLQYLSPIQGHIMLRQELKDKLFKQLEVHWQEFENEVSKANTHLQNKLRELVKIYGPEIIQTLLDQVELNPQLQLGDNTQAAAPAKAKKLIKKAKVTPSKRKVRRPRKLKLSGKERNRRAHQVTYLNLLKKFSARGRVKYKHIFKKQGCQAAIDAMNSFLSK